MPFSPLPATFVDEVTRCGPGGALELGSGQGVFTSVLKQHGCDPWTLDRRGPPLGGRPAVIGDALHPPLRSGFALVVAANLLRHVWATVASEGPRAWQDLIAPGGSLWILEDEPCERPPAARNYRDLQDLLADLQPGRHGRLLPRATFDAARRRWPGSGAWASGVAENVWPADAPAVVAMLDAGRPEATGRVARLRDALSRTGLSYGRYWWACWRPEGGA